MDFINSNSVYYYMTKHAEHVEQVTFHNSLLRVTYSLESVCFLLPISTRIKFELTMYLATS